jgi:hypothetical protein
MSQIDTLSRELYYPTEAQLAAICKRCGAPYGKHSHPEDLCPRKNWKRDNSMRAYRNVGFSPRWALNVGEI